MQVLSSVVLLALVVCWCRFSAINGQATGCARKQFDFEVSGQAGCFQTTGPISAAITTEQYKHGSHSLGVTVTDSLVMTPQPNLRLGTDIQGRELKKGGFKLWLYRETKRTETLTVKFEDTGRNKNVSEFDVNLDFKGWRGIWVSYNECRTERNILNRPNAMVDAMHLEFPAGSDKMYIDLLEMVTKIRKQSRDKIVPPFTRFGSLYDTSNFWQQTHKWSRESPSATPTFQQSKIEEMAAIEDRLRNWYVDKTKATYELTDNEKQRWDTLLVNIEASHVGYANLVKVGSIIKSPTLFSRDSTYGKTTGTRKFGDVFTKVLLPLSLEYHIRTRDAEKRYIIGTISGSLHSTVPNTVEDAIGLIAGNDPAMQDTFRTSFSGSNDVDASLAALNAARLQRIFDVHDYLEDQGWADGSAVGSLDHEMNKNGAGFVHSMYLVKNALHMDSARLDKVIKTIKWYTDFGEIYQNTFEFSGSTADRIKTLMLYRLLVILLMPDGAEKIRDMDAFQRWTNNALSINKALGGLIKPDFTAFHHKAFYPSAYVPHALHTAALVYHLLGDTSFQMSSVTIDNLKNALETLNIVAVKYSMPVSVGGRYPKYTRTSFLNIIPAYAYVSESYSSGLFSVSDPGKFARLHSIGDPEVQAFLGAGNILSGSYYMNTIGSLTVMQQVHALAGTTVGDSPHGNWAKNFAALSVHRRDDWQVSVKGFNNYVWDFESSYKPENAFGLFQSHGALQISESQESLISQDTSAGWEWAKVPGTTTIDLTLDEMKNSEDRFFNPEPLAGGLTFQGSSLLANGLFGMNFAQPTYDKPMLRNIDFKFKKSVFLLDNLLVCIGSGITLRDPSKADRKALTTLFQKIQIDPPITRIKVNGVERLLRTPFSAPAFTADTTLVDTNGNGFFIPAGTASSLKVEISDQTSRDHTDENDTSGRYSTAWLEHTQSNSHYEFAVIVNSDLKSFNIDALATAQSTTDQVYTVLRNSVSTHAVKFLRNPETGAMMTSAPVVGYVIFGDNPSDLPTDEPIAEVNKPCLLMVEEDETNIKISISSPDLGFALGRLDSAADVTADGLYSAESRKTTITVTLSYEDGDISLSHASPHGGVHYTPDVSVDSNTLVDGKVRNKVVFTDLTNGFSVEAHFLKLGVPV